MDKKEKAYCKHDLNVLFGSEVQNVDLESHYPKTKVSSMYGMMCDELVEPTQLKGEIYNFNATRSELEKYSEELKENLELKDYGFIAERYSPDGKILYTKSLTNTLKKLGFERIAELCNTSMCVALNGFDSFCDEGILQIGDIFSYDTDMFYFEGFPISCILKEKWGYWSAKNERDREDSLQLADEEYICLIEDEEELAIVMSNLGIYAIIELS